MSVYCIKVNAFEKELLYSNLKTLKQMSDKAKSFEGEFSNKKNLAQLYLIYTGLIEKVRTASLYENK